MKRVVAAAIVAGSLLCPAVASAQGFARFWLDVDFGLANAAESTFTASTTFTLFGEPATFGTDYELPSATTYAFGGGFMFNRRLGFGANVQFATHEEFGTLTARVPHPVLFNVYGTDEAPTSETLPRSERALNIHVMFVAVDTGKLRIRVYGGPSHVSINQTVIEDFTYVQTFTTSPPTNTIAITANDPPVEYEASGWGFHLGGDVSYFFTKSLGVGGFARFVKGSVEMDNPMPGGVLLNLDTGGVQFGGGLRLRF